MNGKGYTTVALIKRKLNCLHEYQTSRFQISNIKKKKKKKIYQQLSVAKVRGKVWTARGHQGPFWRHKNVLHFDLWQLHNLVTKNLLSVYLKQVYFIIFKLKLNKLEFLKTVEEQTNKEETNSYIPNTLSRCDNQNPPKQQFTLCPPN